jgi:phosphoribosylpyrophosphate synthetase
VIKIDTKLKVPVCQAGESYGAPLITKLLPTASADHLIVCESHTVSLHLFFNETVNQVSSYAVFESYLKTL